MDSEINLKITSMSSSGEGIGSLEGLKVFVDGALPGETVLAKISQRKKKYAKAQLLKILSPSDARIQPHCPLFNACGGCQIMHLQYPAQLMLKQERVIDAFQRIGGFQTAKVLPCLPSPLSLGYRNKIQLPVVWEHGKKKLGLYKKKSHEIIPLKRCMIQCSGGEEILSIISDRLTIPSVKYVLIRNAIFNEQALVIFVTNGKFSKELKLFAEELMEANSLIQGVVENVNTRNDNVILGSTFRLLVGKPFIYETLLNKTFKISPSAFFQVNPGQAENLYQKALDLAEIKPHEVVVDAYCGVGTLALFAADKAHHVYGIEPISQAIANANENARINTAENCTFVCAKAEDYIQQIENLDVVFLNPPRGGCAPEMLDALLDKKPKRIVYISCDPATLARDLKILSGRYTIDQIQPLDMFPQTMHVETIVRMLIT